MGIYQLSDGWYGHDGETIGWQAIELHNPDTGVSVAMAGNACASVSVIFWAILNELYPDPGDRRVPHLQRALPQWTERSAAAAIRPTNEQETYPCPTNSMHRSDDRAGPSGS